jgi:hypothetical protein
LRDCTGNLVPDQLVGNASLDSSGLDVNCSGKIQIRRFVVESQHSAQGLDVC